MDLWGRPSNPSEILEELADQGRSARQQSPRGTRSHSNRPETGGPRIPPEERGRLSNPVLRRLSPTQIDRLVSLYAQGASVAALVAQYGVHRTTAMTYLERRGVAPRRQGRKMNDDSVTVAVQRYEGGLSLAAVAAEFGSTNARSPENSEPQA